MAGRGVESVCVYCGSRYGADAAFRQAAQRLGRAIGECGLRLVFGGGRVGLMGELAEAALAAGGRVLGVMPESLVARELAHPGLTELQVVADMHARKLAMSDAADAFIALPGGLGTLDELFETLTWKQLGWHDKSCGLLDVDGFYAPFRALLDHLVAAEFVDARRTADVRAAAEPETLLARLGAGCAPRASAGGRGRSLGCR